jgi:hypothetical protein
MVHVLERSQDNDHEKGVVNEPVLCEHLNILLKLANDSLSLALGNLELLEALEEILILKRSVLVHLLL